MNVMTPRHFEHYVGIPWLDGGRTRAGVDCWGLFCLVYKEMFNIELPAHSEDYTTALDRMVIRRLIDEGKDCWMPVTLPEQGDGALMYIANRAHIGVVIGGGYMLHIEKGSGAVIESYYGMRISNVLEGFYRYSP